MNERSFSLCRTASRLPWGVSALIGGVCEKIEKIVKSEIFVKIMLKYPFNYDSILDIGGI